MTLWPWQYENVWVKNTWATSVSYQSKTHPISVWGLWMFILKWLTPQEINFWHSPSSQNHQNLICERGMSFTFFTSIHILMLQTCFFSLKQPTVGIPRKPCSAELIRRQWRCNESVSPERSWSVRTYRQLAKAHRLAMWASQKLRQMWVKMYLPCFFLGLRNTKKAL